MGRQQAANQSGQPYRRHTHACIRRREKHAGASAAQLLLTERSEKPSTDRSCMNRVPTSNLRQGAAALAAAAQQALSAALGRPCRSASHWQARRHLAALSSFCMPLPGMPASAAASPREHHVAAAPHPQRVVAVVAVGGGREAGAGGAERHVRHRHKVGLGHLHPVVCIDDVDLPAAAEIDAQLSAAAWWWRAREGRAGQQEEQPAASAGQAACGKLRDPSSRLPCQGGLTPRTQQLLMEVRPMAL